MDLKMKVQEVKEYSNKKNELITLIQNYVKKYKEYTDAYNILFKNWSEKLVSEFTNIFETEGFNVLKRENNYADLHERHLTITATIIDLEFQLYMTKGWDYMNFFQTKPESDKKQININPTIERYRLNEISIKHGYGDIKIHNIDDFKKQIERINNAEYSIEEMNELKCLIEKEFNLLLKELNTIETEKYRGKANFTERINGNKKNKDYGEFDSLNELIERI